MLSSDLRGADYRAKAQQALVSADASPLLQVRRKHEAAASVWLGLAAFEDRRSAHARAVTLQLAARSQRALGPQPVEFVPCET